MKTINSLTAALAMVAAGAPLVSHAQDPAAAYKQIQTLRQGGKNAEALKVADQLIAVYGNPKSRVAKQFAHFTPFFYFQKGEILTDLGELDKAYETFKELNTNPQYKDKALIERSKELPGWKEEGFVPLVSAALFQMGNTRYQQASGKNGDPSKYEECISLLEEYLKLYEGNKVTKMERSWKLDGKVCFMLMQSYLLKSQPDFDKAGKYVEKGRRAKAALPDDMVMNGLKTVLSIALDKPEYVAWGEKMISANLGSYHLSPERMALHSVLMVNYGTKSAKIWDAALRAGDLRQAVDAARTTVSLYGLSHDASVTVDALSELNKYTGSANALIDDRFMGVKYDPVRNKKMAETYAEYITNHTEPEAIAILTLANSASNMGSKRLAKAGYKVLLDRYPSMQQAKKSESGEQKFSPLRDLNYMQYAQLSRMTGDEETANLYEQKVDASNVGEENKHVVIINKMARLVKEKQWAEVVPVADEVMKALSDDKGSVNYVSAWFSKLAALYMLHRFDEVVTEGEALLASGMLEPGKIKEKAAREYETQTLFFVTDAAKDLGAENPAMLDKSLSTAEAFMLKYPSKDMKENPMAPNVYFDAVSVLLKRRGNGKPEDDKRDLEKALRYCEYIYNTWPEHDLYPMSLLVAANIIINGEDEAKKVEAIPLLERCVEAGLQMPDNKGRDAASNALYWLCEYSPDLPLENEDDAAVQARVAGYFDRFWKEADCEGNNYALQMAALELMRARDRARDSKAEAAYDKALANTQKVIGREATHAFRNNVHDPELEMTINTYVECYVDGQKKFHDKELTLDEKSVHLLNFPGIQKADKYTNAIFHMALLSSMNEAMLAAKRAGNTARAGELERDIAGSFRKMRDSFKPADLTNFICVQVGNYEVDYARRLPAGSKERKEEANMALTYFDHVLASGGRDMQSEAKLGRANALTLSDSDAHHKEAFTLYTGLAADSSPEVVATALIGLTDLNMSTKNYKAAAETANKFISMRIGTSGQRNAMLLKLGEAYCESGDVQKGLQTYMNLYNQNRGQISYSAPACKAMMEQYWKRNTPASGDRLKGTFKASDRWMAWNTGNSYVKSIERSGIVPKMTPSERDLFNEVLVLVDRYSKDRAVQEESRENANFNSKLGK